MSPEPISIRPDSPIVRSAVQCIVPDEPAPPDSPARLSLPLRTVGLACGAYLLILLLNQLRTEWTVNEQYRYGWAVPFMALLLGYRRRRKNGLQGSTGALENCVPEKSISHRISGASNLFQTTSVVLLVALLPIRLIQEANSDWRWVSWGLALAVVGLGCAGTYLLAGPVTLRRYAFPLLFILVAVPWPSGLEQWLVLHLSGFNTVICVEILGLAGIPAIPRGNLIELSTGVVEIDAACSGIRSLQAVVMASLFFGELYRLTVRNRFKVFGIGTALALLCNIARTVLLVWIAATRGLPAMQSWHDPAGVAILLACLTGLWLASEYFRSPKAFAPGRDSFHDIPFVSTVRTGHLVAVLCWFAIIELTTSLWYRSKEAHLPPPAVWAFQASREKIDFKPLEISTEVRRTLRFDTAEHSRWRDVTGKAIESYFFSWLPNRSAATLARNHTPDICFPSAGRQISELGNVSMAVHGLTLPFRQFAIRFGQQQSYLFYCLWEDRSVVQSLDAELLTVSSRLRNVWEGRRNLGQRVLDVAIAGARSPEEAQETLRRILEESVTVQK